MQTMREIIDVVGGYRHLAEVLGCPAGTVSAWRSRDILPSEYWSEVAAECAKQGHPDVTVERLALIAARAKGRLPDALPVAAPQQEAPR